MWKIAGEELVNYTFLPFRMINIMAIQSIFTTET